MAVPTPTSFSSGDLSSSEMNSSVFDPLDYLFNSAQVAIQRVAAVSLTQGVFSSIDSVTCTESGIFVAYASVRCSSVRGNKELRLTVNGAYDDGDDWVATANQFGVATPAFSSLACAGIVSCTAGDDIEYGVFVDTPDACAVDNGVMGIIWLRNA